MEYPNKIYTVEYKGETDFNYKSHFVIVVAASDSETARKYVKEQVGIDESPTWLMNSVYPTLYTSDGSRPASVQAKILYNGNCHFKSK